MSEPDDSNHESYLIVGLGNPGRDHRNNRHNVGYKVVDCLAEHLGVSFSRMELKSLVTKSDRHGKRIILSKPQTYMNLSGLAVSSLVRFYKIPLIKLLVIYDDVDLPFETIRLRPLGGSGGHNGMNSIIERLGSQEFPRLRIGVNRPPGSMDAANYVLKDFSKNEIEFLPGILDRSIEAVIRFIEDGIDVAMNLYNTPPSSN